MVGGFEKGKELIAAVGTNAKLLYLLYSIVAITLLLLFAGKKGVGEDGNGSGASLFYGAGF